MKLDTEFTKLPLRFDVERMRAEVEAIPESDWRPHPQGHPGNSALPLIALDGDPTNDGVAGTMLPTSHLERCPYLQQVLASFQTVFGRSRLMRLEGQSEATLHVDTNYYWADRVRIHVPILTSPVIEFICNEKSLHMAAGEAWIFDAWKLHNVLNPTGEQRIHLVGDTVGSAVFWDLVARGERPFADNGAAPAEARLVEFRDDAQVRLETERSNYPVVMSPWEQALLLREMFDDLAPNGAGAAIQELRAALDEFARDWRVAWARFGDSREGWPVFQRLREAADQRIDPLAGAIALTNRTDAVEIARQMLLRPALNPQLAPQPGANGGAAAPPQQPPPVRAERVAPRSFNAHRFDRPIFIVAPPRSGTTLLFEALARSPSVWTVGGESHHVIESLPGLQPANRGWDSNRLTPTDSTPAAAERLREAFVAELRDREGNRPADARDALRMLEKTPKNSLRVPFLNAIWPRALFVYLYRDPRECLSSMITAWESGRFVTYPNLPDWPGPPWSLVLTPEWRQLAGRPLPEIVADQWSKATHLLLGDLDRIPAARVLSVAYDDLVGSPQSVVERVCAFAEIEFDEELPAELPLSRYTLTPPEPEKWRRHEEELAPLLSRIEALDERARRRLEAEPETQAPSEEAVTPGAGAHPLRSVNTANFHEILDQLDSSLLITTYQTGRLICARHTEEGLNTHFRGFDTPMGLAWNPPKLAIGTGSQVWEYLNVPDVAAKLEPAPERHDGCLIPRRVHYTGDIRVHDVAYAGDELWVVATRFSCLATLDDEHSFVPRWRPPFITGLAADDRCHLNGLAVIDDQVRYVTALGASDEPGGWREHKAAGGVLIDVPSSETAISGLSMPHSPRWYRDRLWLLESGQGTLVVADLDAGTVETVAELPGFTRGLAFAGPLAFVGLSEVREATTFGGLPLTGRLEDRHCGVWVVNIETGTVIGFLRFEDQVQEIFDVAILPGMRFPEVAEHGSDVVNLSYVVPEATL